MNKLFTSLKYVMTLAALVLSANVMAGTGEWVASAQGYNNAQDVSSFDIDEVVSVTLDKGTNSYGPKYYNTGAALRLYGGNSMTIACASGKITGIVFTYGDGDSNYTNTISVDTGDFAGNSWEGSATSVTFTIGGTTGQRRIAKIEVTYGSGGGVTVKRPTISPEGGTYTEPVDVEITAESGLRILYSMDNTTYNYYYSPIHLTESATVYAIAEDASGNKSSAVSAAYTIVDLSGLEGSGTATDPYTVGDAMALYAASSLPADKVFVKGKISRIKSLDVSQFTRAQYYISDDGTTTSDELYIYNGYYLNGEAFTANDQIKVGDDVVIYGKLVLFGSTKEMDQNNFIYQLNGEGGGSIEVKTYETIAAAKAGAKDTAAEAILKLNDVVVTYVDGTNYYISDGNDGFLIYGSISGLTDVAAGDVLSGTVKGDLYTYHGLPEMTPATAGTEVTKTGTTEVVPEAVEMGDVLADGLAYSSKLVKLSEVMFGAAELTTEEGGKHGQVTIMSMGEEALLFDQFDQAKGLTFDTEAEDYEFSAIVCLRDGVVQFYPTNKEELERDTPEPQYPTYNYIADMNAAATADKVKSIYKQNELLVTYVNGKNIYIQDRGNWCFLLFGTPATAVKAGDMINVEITGELYLYHGLPELSFNKEDAEITVIAEGKAVEASEQNVAYLAQCAASGDMGYYSMLIKLNGVVFQTETLTDKAVTFTQNGADAILYDQFGILTDITFDTTEQYSITVIMTVRDGVVQFYPIDRSEFITEQYVFDGEGTEESPYSVADVRYLQLNSQAPADKVWVKGTIIGCVNGSFKEEKFACTEGDENLIASNIVIADAPAGSAGLRKEVADGYDLNKCIPVELKANTVFREKLNLVDNIGNVGKEILVNGNIMPYFSVPGVKNLDDAIIDGVSLGVHGVEMDKEVLGGTIYTLSGQKVNSITRHGLYIIGGKKVLMK